MQVAIGDATVPGHHRAARQLQPPRRQPPQVVRAAAGARLPEDAALGSGRASLRRRWRPSLCLHSLRSKTCLKRCRFVRDQAPCQEGGGARNPLHSKLAAGVRQAVQKISSTEIIDKRAGAVTIHRLPSHLNGVLSRGRGHGHLAVMHRGCDDRVAISAPAWTCPPGAFLGSFMPLRHCVQLLERP